MLPPSRTPTPFETKSKESANALSISDRFSVPTGRIPYWYDGTRLARKNDVVVVTLNHRLNVFGYCYLGELTTAERFADAGNVGMLDCVQQALEPYCTVQSVIVESSFTKMRLPDTVGCAQVALSATS